ncbi:MAG: hypothetical protein KF905_01920 [Flavobacteriales bacterium]|nr:hypothetical protein [Flavobacteriales bacterium]
MNSLNASRVLAIALLAAPTTGTFAQELLDHWWQPDGAVYSVVEDEANGVVYVGGAFEKVGPPMYGGTPLDRSTGLPVHTAPLPSDQAYDVVPDGQGGYYLGGTFTAVDGQPRNRIAHVPASGVLLPFGGEAGAGFDAGTVERMLLHDGVLYVAHRQLATSSQIVPGYTGPVSKTNGAFGWDASTLDGYAIGAFAAPNNGWYMYGGVVHVGGVRRGGIARISANGAAHPWDLQVNGGVASCVVVGDVMYLAGGFNSVLGQPRSGMAAIHIPTWSLLPFSAVFSTAFGSIQNPHPIRILPLGDKLYLFGNFESINGAGSNPGWVDATTGANVVPPFTTNGILSSMVVHDGLAWLCGNFSVINGEPRSGFAVVDAGSGELLPTPFSVEGGQVQGLLLEDGQLYLRGTFTSINGEARSGLARIDAATGQLSPWAPQVSGVVEEFLLSDGLLYLSGPFAAVNGQVRNGAAAVDAQSGELANWHPQHPGAKTLLGSNGEAVFLRCDPVTTTAVPGLRVVALDAMSGEPTGWQLQVEGPSTPQVMDMLVADDALFLAGSFNSIDGTPRNSVAKVDLGNAQVLPWDIGLNGNVVLRLAPRGDELFLCGGFTQVSGEPRMHLAAVSATNGEVLPFTLSLSGYQGTPVAVNDIDIVNDTLYLVGKFWQVNGEFCASMAAVDLQSGQLTDWAPWDINSWSDDMGGVDAIEVSGDTVFVGGRFNYLTQPGTWISEQRNGLAATDRSTGAVLEEVQAPYGVVFRLKVIDSRLFALGINNYLYDRKLSWVGGGSRTALVAMDVISGEPIAQQIDVVGEVHALRLTDGQLYLAGPITEVQGQATSGVVRIDTQTGTLVPFASVVPWSDELHAFAVHEGRIYMGSEAGLLVYDAVTGMPVPWPLQANGRVRALDMLGNVLYMGGDFTEVGGQARMRLAAIDVASLTLMDWAPSVTGSVRDISASSNGVAIVGSFSDVQNTYRDGFAVLTTLDAAVLPHVRFWEDCCIPPTYSVAAEGDLVVLCTNPTPNDPLASVTSYLESFHMPSGSGTGLPVGDAEGAAQGAFSSWTPGAFLHANLNNERIYLVGEFARIRDLWSNRSARHNLAVYSRPQPKGVRVSPRVRLGGASTSSGNMSDSLRVLGLLPAVEPYSALGYGHSLHGGAEVRMPVFDVPDNNAIVDWVVVELRAAPTPHRCWARAASCICGAMVL